MDSGRTELFWSPCQMAWVILLPAQVPCRRRLKTASGNVWQRSIPCVLGDSVELLMRRQDGHQAVMETKWADSPQ